MKKNNKYSIGIFDSGFGGLEILKEVRQVLPNYNYIFLGDNARTPYGTRSQETIYKFTKQAIDFLFKKNCYLVILACNTASSKALRKIQRQYLKVNYPKRRVLGVLIPACQQAISKTKNKKVGVIGTEATISSKAFVKEIIKLNPNIKIFQKSCPLLVCIVESGEQDLNVTNLALKNYLNPLKKSRVDTLILGCTHYGVLKSKIRKIMGSKVKVISEGKVVGQKLKAYLNNHPEIKNRLEKKGKLVFYTTDLSKKFANLGSIFFGKKINAKKVILE
ncbi:glutamate racemase [Patescibacteria group bacterium]